MLSPPFRRISKQAEQHSSRFGPPPTYDFHSLLTELEQTIAMEREKNAHLTAQLELKVRKEKELISLLRSYNDELHSGPNTRAAGESLKHFEKIKGMHQKLLGHISGLQDAAGKEISKHENTLLRTFNNKLTEIKDELEDEKKRKVERLQQLERREAELQQELELMKVSVVLVGQQNKELYRENQELRRVVKTQSEVETQLHFKMHSLKRKMSSIGSSISPQSPIASPSHLRSLSMSKSQDIAIETDPKSVGHADFESNAVKRLQKALLLEKKKTSRAKQELADYLGGKTELEMLIKNCIEDAKSDARRMSGGSAAGERGLVTKTQRDIFVEKLLAKEEVLSLLYQKAFPLKGKLILKSRWVTAPNSPNDSVLPH